MVLHFSATKKIGDRPLFKPGALFNLLPQYIYIYTHIHTYTQFFYSVTKTIYFSICIYKDTYRYTHTHTSYT